MVERIELPKKSRRPRTSAPRYIILHSTQGPASIARQYAATVGWFQAGGDPRRHVGYGPASDILIGHDGREAWFTLDGEDYHTTRANWSAGFGASSAETYGSDEHGISIELAQTSAGERPTDATLEAAVRRCAALCGEYGIEPRRIEHLRQRRSEPIPSGLVGHEDTENGRKCIAADTMLAAVVDGAMRFAPADEVLVHDDVLLPCVEGDRVEWRRPVWRGRSTRLTYSVAVEGATPVRATEDHRWAQYARGGRFYPAGDGCPEQDRGIALWETAGLSDGFRVPLRLHLPRPDFVIDRAAGAATHGRDAGEDGEAGYLVGMRLAGGSGACDRSERVARAAGPRMSRGVRAPAIDRFVSGSTRETRRLTQDAWAMPQPFLAGLMQGYLDGAGREVEPGRYSLDMPANPGLLDDLRFLCLLLGYEFRQRSSTTNDGHRVLSATVRAAPAPGCAGDGMRGVYVHRVVRGAPRPHAEEPVWDVTVGGSGLFVLGSGLVTHNSGKWDPNKRTFPWDWFIARLQAELGREEPEMAASNAYIVTPGDTLGVIARRFNLTIAQLAEWNAIPDVNVIRAGQVLRLTPDAPLPVLPASLPDGELSFAVGGIQAVQRLLGDAGAALQAEVDRLQSLRTQLADGNLDGGTDGGGADGDGGTDG